MKPCAGKQWSQQERMVKALGEDPKGDGTMELFQALAAESGSDLRSKETIPT